MDGLQRRLNHLRKALEKSPALFEFSEDVTEIREGLCRLSEASAPAELNSPANKLRHLLADIKEKTPGDETIITQLGEVEKLAESLK
ncbi:MAG: hypothetical protein GY757_21550 [bacterium]|nr:hypothetical protein [bacterium]